jgi:hypothetical protein
MKVNNNLIFHEKYVIQLRIAWYSKVEIKI